MMTINLIRLREKVTVANTVFDPLVVYFHPEKCCNVISPSQKIDILFVLQHLRNFLIHRDRYMPCDGLTGFVLLLSIFFFLTLSTIPLIKDRKFLVSA